MGFARRAATGRRAALVWIGCAVTAAACSTTTPTSPTAETGAALVGTASQETPSLPASLVPVPPQALGATRFLAFGDSITWGQISSFDQGIIVADPSGSYPRLLREMLNGYNLPGGFAVLNYGVPGETARTGVDRLPGVLGSFAPADKPQVVLLLEGINDMNVNNASPSQVATNVLNLVQIARLHNCTVLVATMPQTYHSTYPSGETRTQSAEKIVPFNNEVRRLVSGLQNVHIVDVYSAFGNDRSLIGGDGLHPSPAGYQRMAQVYHQRISQIFPVRGSLQ
jgi:lysophospholipase L1-like esterase